MRVNLKKKVINLKFEFTLEQKSELSESSDDSKDNHQYILTHKVTQIVSDDFSPMLKALS